MGSHRADVLAASGRVEEAVLLLGKLAATGNGEALFKLAQWRTEGQLLPRDLGLARDLYRRAGAAGSIGGATAYLAFLCTGVGGPRDWPNGLALLRLLAARDVEARRQLDIVEKMSISGEGDPLSLPKPEILSPQPHASMIPGLLSAAECDYLIETAEPLFWRSLTVDEKTGRQFVNPIRTSEAAAFPWVMENPAIHALNRRIAAASGTQAAQGEPVQILRYSGGQEYKPHFDAIPGLDNQRVLTVLVYLNEDYEGGETRFLKSGLTVRGQRGDALLFSNVRGDGTPDPDTMHAGLPVTGGKKLLLSRWIRQRPLSA